VQHFSEQGAENSTQSNLQVGKWLNGKDQKKLKIKNFTKPIKRDMRVGLDNLG